MSLHENGHVCHSFLDFFLAVEYRKLIFVQLYTILKLEYVVFQIAAFGEKYHYGDRKKISTTQLTWRNIHALTHLIVTFVLYITHFVNCIHAGPLQKTNVNN